MSHIRWVRQHQFITTAIGPKYIRPIGRHKNHGIRLTIQFPLTLVASGITKYIWPSANTKLNHWPERQASFRVAYGIARSHGTSATKTNGRRLSGANAARIRSADAAGATQTGTNEDRRQN